MVESPRTTVYFQDACLSHRFVRSRDTSTVFERPQRLRAVKTGVAAAIARLEQSNNNSGDSAANGDDVLTNALERLTLTNLGTQAVNIVMSSASVDILNHAAVKYVHGDINGNAYLERLITLTRESEDKITRGESEIPEDLSQGDLYLCKGSLDAIQGALGTVCEAVDGVMAFTTTQKPTSVGDIPLSVQSQPSRAFVAIRPPGHHCGEDTPSGFCFVNNVVVGAAHAHLQHDITRVMILDIDLHHGNGTQSIAWQINDETYLQKTSSKASDKPGKQGLSIFYGSIHDILSYPCEDGNAAMIQAASVSIHGAHGQHIENVHLMPYESDKDFWDRLYYGPYSRLLQKAESFMQSDIPGEAIIFISAGFDASEHENSSMSRHGRKLPTSFYHRFTRDARKIADKYAKGRLISVLEGGYSDRALCSGAMAHVIGLAEADSEADPAWWSLDNLIKIEKESKRRRNGRVSGTAPAPSEKWLERMVSTLSNLCPDSSPPSTPKTYSPSLMKLRDRSKRSLASPSNTSESGKLTHKVDSPNAGDRSISRPPRSANNSQEQSENEEVVNAEAREEPKKLPRVVLRVNPPAVNEMR